MPALLETQVREVMWGWETRARMRVLGVPQRPKPPERMVLLEGMSFMASRAEG